MGEFNAHHTAFGFTTNKPRGNQINDMLDEINLYLLNNGQPTTLARPDHAASAIDIFYFTVSRSFCRMVCLRQGYIR